MQQFTETEVKKKEGKPISELSFRKINRRRERT